MLKQIEGWQMWASDAQFRLVKETLTAFIQNFQRELLGETERYRTELRQAESGQEAALAALKREKYTVPEEAARSERDKRMHAVYNGWRGQGGILPKTRAGLEWAQRSCTYRAPNGFLDGQRIRRAKERNAAMQEAFRQGAVSLQQKAGNIDAMINRLSVLADRVYEYKRALAQREYDTAARQAAAKHEETLKVLYQTHLERLEEIKNRYQSTFSACFNPDTLNVARSNAANIMVSQEPDAYKCRAAVPEVMYFGDRTFIINSGSDTFEDGIVGMINSLSHPFFRMGSNNAAVVVKLPYCRTIEEGYSVFAVCDNAQGPHAEEAIRAYTMKVLMNFPPRVRPLLMDSDSTAAFSLFSGFGEAVGRNFSTRPLNKGEEIATELQKLESEHHQLITSYGEDRASRLAREPFYFVACRNFPKEISERAMRDLDVIWFAGSANGFFGMVTAEPRELEKVRTRDPITRMQQHSLMLTEQGAGWIIGGAGGGDYLTFDMLPKVMASPKEMLQKIVYEYVHAPEPRIPFEAVFSMDAGNAEGIDVNVVNSWQRGSAAQRCDIPIGVFGAHNVQKFTVNKTNQHALISGITGAGKSTLLRTLIMAAMIKFDPDQVNFYLVDFKEGVEFAPFAPYNLPWIRMIAVSTEREFALSILQELEGEFNRRAEIMTNRKISSIHLATDEPFPRIFLVFDEVQLLLREDDALTGECLRILEKLVEEGRAMNINVILASQNLDQCIGLDRLKNNMAIRIGLAGSSESAKYILGDGINPTQYENGSSGFAAIRTEENASQITYFQVGILSETERDRLLEQLAMISAHRKHVTRILSKNADMDVNNRFNRLILRRDLDRVDEPSAYELTLGEFNDAEQYIRFAPQPGNNLLLVGESEESAKSITALAVMSFLYDELTANARRLDNELVRLLDLSSNPAKDADFYRDADDVDYAKKDFYFLKLERLFSRQVSRANKNSMDRLINDTYDHVIQRKNGDEDATERLLLVVFGFGGAHTRWQNAAVEGRYGADMTLMQKLTAILTEGPAVGVNTVLWTQSLTALTIHLPMQQIDETMFMRIFYGRNVDGVCERLTGVTPESTVTNGRMAQYKHVDEVSSPKLRLYELPKLEWIRSFAEVYNRIIDERNTN